MIPISDFDPGPNSLEIFLTLTDGRVVRRALNVPVTGYYYAQCVCSIQM